MHAEQLAEIRAGLSLPQKQLPTKLFYDQRGSELFEEITRLPEYYLTRTEAALLRDRIPGFVARMRPRSLVELGAGNAAKTRVILDAMVAASGSGTYVPVDISAEFLTGTADELRRDYPQLDVVPVAADFTKPIPLAFPPTLARPALVTILGSTIGNFAAATATALLRRVRAALHDADRFLLGVDLRKDVGVVEAAYNDARGVTAEFNLNVLRVVNREFGADFDVAAFRHRACYDEHEHRIEMHLIATRPMTVHLPGAGDFAFAEGETIRTEISCKYDRDAVAGIFRDAGLRVEEWHEDDDRLFALVIGAPA